LRAINDTLRAAAPIDCRIGPRAGFAVRMARERLEGLPRHPEARHRRSRRRGTVARRRCSEQLRPVEILRQAKRAGRDSSVFMHRIAAPHMACRGPRIAPRRSNAGAVCQRIPIRRT